MPRRRQYIFADRPHRGRSFLIGLMVVVLLLGAVLFTWNFALNHTVSFHRQVVTIANLPAKLENWSILHLSDLNGAYIGEAQAAVKKAIGTRTVSCIVLSGNMVGEAGDVQPVLDLIRVLPPETPILLLPGDADPPLYATAAHSTLSPYADWAATLQSHGVTILDEPVRFDREKATIWFVPENLYSLDIAGTRKVYQNLLDTLNAQVGTLTPDQAAQKRNAEYQVARMDRIGEAIASMTAKHIQVVVSHMPLTREYVADARLHARESDIFSMHHVSLVLAGGYCAGQWRLPWGGAVYAPGLGFFPEDHLLTGLGYLSGVWQYISPGLGASPDYPFMPFRLFNSPGVSLLVLSTSLQ